MTRGIPSLTWRTVLPASCHGGLAHPCRTQPRPPGRANRPWRAPAIHAVGAAWLGGVVLLAVGGCEGLQRRSHEQTRAEAKQRWDSVRGQVKLQLARGQFRAGHVDEADVQVQEALALDPTNRDGWVLLGRIRVEQGKCAEALRALEAAAADPHPPAADVEYLRGVIAQKQGRTPEALGHYQRAWRLDPKDPANLAAVAETLVALGRAPEALELVRQGLAGFDQDVSLIWLAGEIHSALGQFDQAAVMFRQACQLLPDDPIAHKDFGVALCAARQWDEAAAVLGALHESARDAAEQPDDVLVRSLARCHLHLGRPRPAKLLLEPLAERDAHSAETWLLLAHAALADGDLMTARRAAQQAVTLQARSGEVHVLLGYVCLRKRQDRLAAQAFETAVRLGANDAMTHCMMGRAYHRLGDLSRAGACYRRALQIDPACRPAQRLLAALPAPGAVEDSTADEVSWRGPMQEPAP